jgi:glucokinase
VLDKNLLLVDIGGTNIRYAYSNIGASDFVSENKAELDSLTNFDNLMSKLLSESNVKNIVFSVAGPKVNNSIKMTNRNFEIDAEAIKQRFNLESCHLLNDWESIGYSMKTFSENDFDNFKEGEPFNDTFLVIGPGTGLGASVISGNNVIATEIGNTNLGLSALKSLLNINSDEFNVLEDIISGTGISRMFETKTGNKVKSEEVFSLSLNGDKNAKEVIDIFTIAFARTLSDLSLTFSSGGGIILAGSLSRSFLSIANKDLFNKHFLDGKSDIHKEILNKIDIKVINKGYTCLYGSLNYVNNI